MSEDDSMSLALGIPLVVALLLANALFVAAEFALITVRRSRIQQKAAEGNRAAKRVMTALGNLDYYIAASQLGITMASIALGTLGEPVLATIIEPPVEAVVGAIAPAIAHTIAILVAFLFVTSLHIVIGEFIPKTIALEDGERTSLLIATPLSVFVRVFGPVIWALNTTANGFLRLLGQDIRPLTDEPLSAEDLSYAFETSASAGLISRRELELTQHLLRLSRTESRELMIPRNQIIALDATAGWSEIAGTFARRPFTRYPVYDGTIDNIVGICDAKQLLLAEDDAVRSAWNSIIRPAVVLPETVRADAAMTAMRRQVMPIAVLVDEFGGTAGLITEFDILRFIAEGLPDDSAFERRHLDQWDRSSPLELSGLVPLSELRELLEIELKDSDAVTVGGFVTEVRQEIPSVGDHISVDRITLTVLEMDTYRVAKVRLDATGDHLADNAAQSEQEARS